MTCEYFYAISDSIQEQIEQVFVQLPNTDDNRIVRIVFFARVADNITYANNERIISQSIGRYFGAMSPVWSYIAQAPLDSTFAAEVWHIPINNVKVDYKTTSGSKYIVIEDETTKSLLASVSSNDKSSSTTSQSSYIFEQIGRILLAESMSIDSIVRQWNYIENITGYQSNTQNYQAFNDSRSRFYAQTSWSNGYPAATGIGTNAGGVVIDFNASIGGTVTAVDNKLQVGAHKYSTNVLIGSKKTATTPKFERAKIVNNILYISGTAAIRGENSIAKQLIANQTVITIENIDELLRTTNKPNVVALRVYIKDTTSFFIASVLVNEHFPTSKTLYVMAEICRDELLIEIEGIATS